MTIIGYAIQNKKTKEFFDINDNVVVYPTWQQAKKMIWKDEDKVVKLKMKVVKMDQTGVE